MDVSTAAIILFVFSGITTLVSTVAMFIEFRGDNPEAPDKIYKVMVPLVAVCCAMALYIFFTIHFTRAIHG